MRTQTLAGWAVAFTLLLLAGTDLHGEKVYLVGGTVINPADSMIIEDAVLVIDGNKIESVSSQKEKEVPSDFRVVDCKGKFVLPGLWDMHVHLAGVTADPKWSKDSLLPLLLANGITGIRDMGGNLDALLSWRREIQAGTLVGPRIIAAGPFLYDAKPGAADTLPVANSEQARSAVQNVKSRHADFVKILTSLSRESFFAIVEEAKKQGLDLVGHVPDSISATEASNAGMKSIEHIFYSNLAFDCSAQEAELRAERTAATAKKDSAALGKIRTAAEATYDSKKADALWQTLIRNKTWVCPTLIAIETVAHQVDLAAKTDDPRLAYMPPALRAQWTPAAIAKDVTPEDTKWWAEQAAYDMKVARAMHAAGVSMLAGSDSLDPLNYPGSSLHRELQWLVRAGFTPMEALQCTTINPARFLARDKAGEVGAIAAGRLADLLILDANPLDDIANTQRISAVVTNGRVYDRAELDRLLERARASVAHD